MRAVFSPPLPTLSLLLLLLLLGSNAVAVAVTRRSLMSLAAGVWQESAMRGRCMFNSTDGDFCTQPGVSQMLLVAKLKRPIKVLGVSIVAVHDSPWFAKDVKLWAKPKETSIRGEFCNAKINAQFLYDTAYYFIGQFQFANELPKANERSKWMKMNRTVAMLAFQRLSSKMFVNQMAMAFKDCQLEIEDPTVNDGSARPTSTFVPEKIFSAAVSGSVGSTAASSSSVPETGRASVGSYTSVRMREIASSSDGEARRTSLNSLDSSELSERSEKFGSTGGNKVGLGIAGLVLAAILVIGCVWKSRRDARRAERDEEEAQNYLRQNCNEYIVEATFAELQDQTEAACDIVVEPESLEKGQEEERAG